MVGVRGSGFGGRSWEARIALEVGLSGCSVLEFRSPYSGFAGFGFVLVFGSG